MNQAPNSLECPKSDMSDLENFVAITNGETPEQESEWGPIGIFDPQNQKSYGVINDPQTRQYFMGFRRLQAKLEALSAKRAHIGPMAARKQIRQLERVVHLYCRTFWLYLYLAFPEADVNGQQPAICKDWNVVAPLTAADLEDDHEVQADLKRGNPEGLLPGTPPRRMSRILLTP
ncbi:MAG: hypothetical protein WCV82_00895 [Candidatus Paceibacterota bacterium]